MGLGDDQVEINVETTETLRGMHLVYQFTASLGTITVYNKFSGVLSDCRCRDFSNAISYAIMGTMLPKGIVVGLCRLFLPIGPPMGVEVRDFIKKNLDFHETVHMGLSFM